MSNHVGNLSLSKTINVSVEEYLCERVYALLGHKIKKEGVQQCLKGNCDRSTIYKRYESGKTDRQSILSRKQVRKMENIVNEAIGMIQRKFGTLFFSV